MAPGKSQHKLLLFLATSLIDDAGNYFCHHNLESFEILKYWTPQTEDVDATSPIRELFQSLKYKNYSHSIFQCLCVLGSNNY